MKTLLALLLFGTVYGALPPLAQSAREIEALVSDPELQKRLGSAEAIEEIRRTDEGYAVLTRSRLLLVQVEHLSSRQKIGPVSFQFRFQEPIPLTSQ